MTCGKNHRSSVLLVSDTAHNFITIKNQLGHLGLEVYFTTTINNSMAHRLNHLRQPVCTDMRVGICQDSRRGTVLTEDI